MCAVMEENKQNLEFIAPEVKVIAVASQRVLCQSETKAEAKIYDLNGTKSYDMQDF